MRIEGDKRIRLNFRGKSGVEHQLTIDDKRLAKTVMRCRNLPGELLFTYLDDEGAPQPVHSEDVNAYLRETMEGEFSAKVFRTFAGTVICATHLAKAPAVETLAEAKAHIKHAVELTAKRLGNTPSVCRKSYVHPAVLDHYTDDRRLDLPDAPVTPGLDADESRVLAYLMQLKHRDESYDSAKRVRLLQRSVRSARATAKTVP